MRTLWKWVAAAVLTVGVAGCAGTGTSSGPPCGSCKYGAGDKKAQASKQYCVVDGKTVDCGTNPAGCPSCAQAK